MAVRHIDGSIRDKKYFYCAKVGEHLRNNSRGADRKFSGIWGVGSPVTVIASRPFG